MKAKFKSKLLGVLLVLVMVLALVPVSASVAFAASGTGTENDPVYVTNYAELKEALERDDDTWIVVNVFNNGNYYTLISGDDYSQTSLDDSAYGCGAINIPTERNKHLTINTTIDCRTASTQQGSLLYCFINNRGNLTIDGNGTLAVSFNAGNYANAIILNQGNLTIDAPITLDATCKSVQSYGRAIMNHSGTFTISDGTYIGFKSNTLGTHGNVGALWQASENANKESIISGGQFQIKDENGFVSNNYALVNSGVDNLTLKGGTFYGIYASQYSLKLSALLGSYCKFQKNGADFNGSSLSDSTDVLSVVNTNLISTVNLTVTAPLNGDNPSAPSISTDNVTIYAHEWKDSSESNMSSFSTFVGGEKYRLQVRVNTTKEFSKNTEIYINGQIATVKSFAENTILCYIDYTAFNKQIDTVQVGLDTPLAGGTVTAPYAYTESVNLTSYEWYPDVAQYEAGHSFRLTFRITPKDGYELSDNLQVRINGKQADITSHDKDYAICQYIFDIPAQEPTAVDEINITVDKPLAGSTPAMPSVSSNQYTLGIHEWNPSEFIAGNNATLTVLVYPSSGYKFVDGTTTAKVNGQTATITVGQGYARIEYTFNVVNVIDNVTLSMTAPVAGANASTTVDDNSNLYDTTMYWTTETNSVTTFSGQFVSGTTYYATFMITTSSPNEFAEGTSVYINGTKYTATWVAQGNVTSIQVKDVAFETLQQAPTEYYVGYFAGDGNGTGESDYYAEGTEFTLKSPELVGISPIEGKVFDYWQIGNPETARKQAGEQITINADTYIYAIWKDIPHECIGILESGQGATCTVDGWKDYYRCECGKYYEDENCTILISDLEVWKIGDGKIAAAHSGTPEWTKTATTHAKKYTCCDTVVVESEAHEWNNGTCSECGYVCLHTNVAVTKKEGQAATCTVDGWKDYYQCACGKYFADEACTTPIADLESWKANDGKIVTEHTYGDLIPEDPAVHTQTELQAGMRAHYHCSVCDTYFDENKVETTANALTIPAPTHSFGDWIKDNEKHWKVCSCGLKADEHTHNYTDSADMICNDCGYDRTVPHTCGNGVLQSGQAATCTVNGWQDYYKCSCGKIYADAACTNEITSLEAWKNGDGKIVASHSYGDLVAKVDATCSQTGMEAHYECSVCHTLFDENKAVKTENELTIDIDANAHTYGAWTSNGDGTHTRVCGINGNHKETVACSGGTATCTEKAVCEVCNTPYGNTTAHEHGSEWHKNADEHWNECACGDKANVASHADENNDGKCDICDYAMGDAGNPGENIEPEKDGLSGGAIAGIVVGSVAVLGLGGFALVWFVIKKKTWAEFLAIFKKG